ncbi:MAG: hypothetical protein ABI402_14830 [Ferruginibacter sp.]
MFHTISPILPTLNIQTTNLFYKDKLNFDISYFGNYLVVSKENIQLFFYEHKDKTTFRSLACFIFVSNIEDLYAKYSSMGMVEPSGQLQIKPGNLKEFGIVDNSGHQLRFGEK